MVITYLENEWLGERIREHVIPAWTDQVCHFGNLTTGRAESIHRALKRDIPHRFLHIQDVIRLCSTYLLVHNNELQQKISQDRQRVRDLHRHPIFKKLHHIISSFAVDKVFRHIKQFNLIANPRAELNPCTGSFTRTMGLPCAHTIQPLLQERRPLQPEQFHLQWRINRHQIINARPWLMEAEDPDIIPTRKRKAKERREPSRWEHIEAEGRQQGSQRQQLPAPAQQQRQQQEITDIQLRAIADAAAATAIQETLTRLTATGLPPPPPPSQGRQQALPTPPRLDRQRALPPTLNRQRALPALLPRPPPPQAPNSLPVRSQRQLLPTSSPDPLQADDPRSSPPVSPAGPQKRSRVIDIDEIDFTEEIDLTGVE